MCPWFVSASDDRDLQPVFKNLLFKESQQGQSKADWRKASVTQNKMPSQKVSSHAFGLVTVKVLNSYKKGI